MSATGNPLDEAYAAALRQYVAGGAEASLERAYHLGRDALDGGRGVLDIAGAHAAVLPDLLAECATPVDAARAASRASEFLIEALSPFEMTHLGFRESVARLRAANTALKKEHDFTAAILDTVGALIVVLNREGRIVRFNRTCERVTGYSSAEALGRHFWEFLLVPEEVEPVKQVFKSLRGDRLPSSFENYWVTKDGQRRLISWANTVILDDHGAVEYVIGTGLDVTERREAEVERARLLGQLQEALKLREEFIAAAAHELRTPVTTLKGYAGLLRKLSAGGQADLGRALEAIEYSADRIARLAHQLVQAAELERGTLPLRTERFDLAQVVAQAAEAAQAGNPTHQFRVQTVPAVVEADRERIGDVVRHLLDNAVKYQPLGGDIDVTVCAVGGEAVASVRDHGPGIPVDRQPYVFEPMYEPLPPGAVGYVGVVGLGLEISKEIVEHHGGRIWVESQPGEGSAFRFSLPLAHTP